MNEQDKARVQLAELINKYGIKLRPMARTVNVGIAYMRLYRFYNGEGTDLSPKELQQVERFYNRVTGGEG